MTVFGRCQFIPAGLRELCVRLCKEIADVLLPEQ